MFATASFTHRDLNVVEGDELPDDHPMVLARPDLFTTNPPPKPKAAKGRKEK